jgi:hypothetical protein
VRKSEKCDKSRKEGERREGKKEIPVGESMSVVEKNKIVALNGLLYPTPVEKKLWYLSTKKYHWFDGAEHFVAQQRDF